MPTPTYTPIASVTLSASASEVVFSGLPQTYRDLILVATGTMITGNTDVLIALNGDTNSSNYSRVYMWGDGSTTGSGTANTRYITQYGYWGTASQATLTVQLMDYSATDKQKTFLTRAGRASVGVDAIASRYASTSAVTSITLTGAAYSFASGTTVNLFGVIS